MVLPLTACLPVVEGNTRGDLPACGKQAGPRR
jgi:hypothetical protein